MLFAIERGFAAGDQFALAAHTGAAGGLVGADDDAANAASIVQRLHGDDHLGRRTVRAGDDALMLEGVVRIYLGNDERHVLVHSPVAAFVDDDAAAFFGPRDEIFGDGVRRAADREVDALESLGLEFLDRVLFAFEFDRAAGASGRG